MYVCYNESKYKRKNRQNHTFLSDHKIILIVGVVGVAKLAVGGNFKLHEFMTELASMANIVSTEERIRCHVCVQLN